MSNTKRSWFQVLGVTAGTAVMSIAGAGAASAHVTVEADSAVAGSSAVLAFSTAHGCEGSPTTKVTIKVPEGINSVAPTVNAGWTVTKVTKKLAAPVKDHHGNTLTERVDRVVYTAKTPLADGYRDVLSMSVPLPEDSAGKVLAFPVVQTCTEGETAWVDLPADGQDSDELEAPAPTITVTAADASGHHETTAGGTADEEGTDQPAVPDAVTTDDGGGGLGLGLAGLIAGLAGMGLGALALLRGRQLST